MTTKWVYPGDNVVVDADDQPLSPAFPDAVAARAAAKLIATERGEVVYAYLGNGRDAIQPNPKVGMGCTICFYTDLRAGTVIAVSPSGNKVTVREDKAIRTDDNGMSECQSYRYEPDPNGSVRTFYRNAQGGYGKGPRLGLGYRNAYFDYSF